MPVGKDEVGAAHEAFIQARHRRADSDLIPRYVSARIDALSADVTSAIEALLSSYDAAQEAVRDLRRATEPDPPETALQAHLRSEVPIRQVITAFKSVYLFVRAYQDALCSGLYELVGLSAGKYRSMSTPLAKPSHPVRALVDEQLPAYFDWFESWRRSRDTMKMGAHFGLFFDGDDNLALAYMYPVGEGGSGMADERITLAEIVEALQISTRLSTLVSQLNAA